MIGADAVQCSVILSGKRRAWSARARAGSRKAENTHIQQVVLESIEAGGRCGRKADERSS